MAEAYKDPAQHQRVSFVKGGIRILGFVFLGFGFVASAAVILVIAEVLGFFEEMT